MDPSGEKRETKVFAGRAVIAKEYGTGASWQTADPVTGTEGKFGTPGFTTEHEPLGQEVLQLDPAEIPEPPANESVSHWHDMEWQCAIPNEYYGSQTNAMPWHCQQSAELDAATNGGIKSIYEANKKPGDPTFIHVNGAPAGDEKETVDDELMHQATHATTKPEDIAHDGNPVGPSSVPDQCDGDVDLENNIVNIRCADSGLPDDFRDASWDSVDENKGARLTDEEEKMIAERVKKIEQRLTEEKCKAFLESHGISISNLKKHLNDKSNRYSALRSTEITVEEAGLISPPIAELLLRPESQARDGAIAVRAWSVSRYTKEIGGYHAIKGSHGQIFYKTFDSVTTIIHENLHLSTGLADIPLAEKLGIGTFSNYREASEAISKTLQKNKCT